MSSWVLLAVTAWLIGLPILSRKIAGWRVPGLVSWHANVRRARSAAALEGLIWFRLPKELQLTHDGCDIVGASRLSAEAWQNVQKLAGAGELLAAGRGNVDHAREVLLETTEAEYPDLWRGYRLARITQAAAFVTGGAAAAILLDDVIAIVARVNAVTS